MCFDVVTEGAGPRFGDDGQDHRARHMWFNEGSEASGERALSKRDSRHASIFLPRRWNLSIAGKAASNAPGNSCFSSSQREKDLPRCAEKLNGCTATMCRRSSRYRSPTERRAIYAGSASLCNRSASSSSFCWPHVRFYREPALGRRSSLRRPRCQPISAPARQ